VILADAESETDGMSEGETCAALYLCLSSCSTGMIL